MKKLAIIAILLCIVFTSAAQTYSTETQTHVFWQPDRKITPEDYRGDGSAVPDKGKSEELGMHTMAFVGTWSIVDTPKKKLQKKGIMEEKIYFAPAFEKTTSYMTDKNDSMGIQYQQLIFDVRELCARKARKELQDYQNEAGGSTGIKAIMYSTVKRDNEEFRSKLTGGIVNSIYIKKDPAAYQEWRDLVDELLNKYEEYATTPEDCYRFVLGKPIIDGYEEAKTVIGPMEKGDTLNIFNINP